LHQAAQVMEKLAKDYPQSKGSMQRALNQAARELLLAQASDWAFIMSAGTMIEYAERRIRMHLGRFKRLAKEIVSRSIDETWLFEIERQDDIFPRLNYRTFA